MHCPFCGHDDTQVKDSRPTDDGAAIRRRRFCAACGQRFTTIERVQLRDLIVAKTDGRRVPFDRDKLARSVRVALRKRPVPRSASSASSTASSASSKPPARATSPASRSANW